MEFQPNGAGSQNPPVPPYPPYPPPYFDPELQRREQERRALRHSTRIAVLPCIFLMLAMLFVSSLLVKYLLAFGMSFEQVAAFLNEPGISYVFSFAISVFCFGVPFVLAVRVGGERVSSLVPLSRPAKGAALPFFLIGVSFCGFANVMSSLAGLFFSSLGFEYSLPDSPAPGGALGFLLSVLVVAIEPGLMEEFAFRGILHGLFRRWGDGFAVLSTAILFGVMHGNFVQMPFAFLVGLVLGFVRVKTGTLWVCCAVHAFNNLISVLFDFLSGVSVDMLNLIYTLYIMLSFLLGFVGLFLLRGQKDLFRFQKPESALSTGECWSAVFAHPLTIVFLVLGLLEALLYLEPVQQLFYSLIYA